MLRRRAQLTRRLGILTSPLRVFLEGTSQLEYVGRLPWSGHFAKFQKLEFCGRKKMAPPVVRAPVPPNFCPPPSLASSDTHAHLGLAADQTALLSYSVVA